MVVDILWPDNAPWWLNLFIWMATFWWYILIGFVPTFYIAVAKLFGMPLLQRWGQDVVIMLYPNKVKFGKFKEEFDPYFKFDNGVYWRDDALQPQPYETPLEELPEKSRKKLDKLRERYAVLSEKKGRTTNDEKELKTIVKQADRIIALGLKVDPINQLHIYNHAINQRIDHMERRPTKVDEILHNNPTPKKIPKHGIWLLQNPRLHFHRHYQLLVRGDGTYQIIPVRDRQQFSIGFWHSLGIIMEEKPKQNIESKEIEGEVGSGGQGKLQTQIMLTTNIVREQMKLVEVQDFQNFSALRASMILKQRAAIENKYNGFEAIISGTFDMRIVLLLIGMCASVGLIFFLLHGGNTSIPGLK